MATGDKKQVVMQADVGVPGGVAAYDATEEALERLNESLSKKLNSYGRGVNLLDNGYFGDPDAIIDQVKGTIEVDGETVRGYTGPGYTIDRWSTQPGVTHILKDGYLRVIKTNDTGWPLLMIQTLESAVSSPVTLSVLIRTNISSNASIAIRLKNQSDNDVAVGRALSSYTDWTLVKITYSGNDVVKKVAFQNGNVATAGQSFDLKAMKLELGTEQTLAHQDEDGNWVLNDPPPDYGTELAKCQRHFFRLKLIDGIPSGYSGAIVAGASVPPASSLTNIYFAISAPVTMRTRPTVSISESGWMLSDYSSGGANVTLTSDTLSSVTCNGLTGNVISLNIRLKNKLAADNLYYLLNGSSTAYIDFSANL